MLHTKNALMDKIKYILIRRQGFPGESYLNWTLKDEGLIEESKEEWLFHAERIAQGKGKGKKKASSCCVQQFVICFYNTDKATLPSFLHLQSTLPLVPGFDLHHLYEMAIFVKSRETSQPYLSWSFSSMGRFSPEALLSSGAQDSTPSRFSSFPYLLLAHCLLSNFEMMEFFKIRCKASSLLPQNSIPGKSHQLLNF